MLAPSFTADMAWRIDVHWKKVAYRQNPHSSIALKISHLVNDKNAGFLVHGDDGTGGWSSSGLGDLNTFVNDDLSVLGIGGSDDRRQEGEVDSAARRKASESDN